MESKVKVSEKGFSSVKGVKIGGQGGNGEVKSQNVPNQNFIEKIQFLRCTHLKQLEDKTKCKDQLTT